MAEIDRQRSLDEAAKVLGLTVAEYIARKPPNDWRDIDTAPKDGTELLGFVPEFDAPYWWCLEPEGTVSGRMVIRFYDKDWVSLAAGESFGELVPIRVKPTKWMPLPEAPKK